MIIDNKYYKIIEIARCIYTDNIMGEQTREKNDTIRRQKSTFAWSVKMGFVRMYAIAINVSVLFESRFALTIHLHKITPTYQKIHVYIYIYTLYIK